jgi:hypothetical protein
MEQATLAHRAELSIKSDAGNQMRVQINVREKNG